MNRKRKRRNIIWKWLLGLGLLILVIGGIFLVINSKPNSSNNSETTPGDTNNQEITKTPSLEPQGDNTSEGEPTISPTEIATTDAPDNDSDGGDIPDNGTEPTQPAEQSENKVQQIIDKMDLYEKICQMFIVFPDSLTGVSNVTAAGEVTKNALSDYPVGGLLYSGGNLVNEKQVTDMIQGAQSYSKLPLFIATDEEGGRVARVMKALQSYSMNAMLTYKDMGTEKASENAKIIAGAIEKYGFNTDFAPVADVWSNPANTVIGDRAYSSDFEQAADLIAAAVQGFEEEGIICTLKHFPGHGNTETDTHYGAAYVTKSLDELRKEEFLPFESGIKAGADMVMIGHIIVSDVDDVPATFSHKIVTEILRNELNFKGVVITDALDMQAMTDFYGSGQIAINAVLAGDDILLCPANLEESVAALMKAVKDGKISEERIDQSVGRILNLKIAKGIIK